MGKNAELTASSGHVIIVDLGWENHSETVILGKVGYLQLFLLAEDCYRSADGSFDPDLVVFERHVGHGQAVRSNRELHTQKC